MTTQCVWEKRVWLDHAEALYKFYILIVNNVMPQSRSMASASSSECFAVLMRVAP
jgi:hypothetical protein